MMTLVVSKTISDAHHLENADKNNTVDHIASFILKLESMLQFVESTFMPFVRYIKSFFKRRIVLLITPLLLL